MKEKKAYGTNILQWILMILMIGSIMYFIIGEIFFQSDSNSLKRESMTFEDGWEQILPDGTSVPTTIPGECDVERGDVLVIRKQLPENQKDTWLCIRSSQQDIRIYVDEDLRIEYTTKNVRKFGKNSVSGYVFLEITNEDAGKDLRMEIVSDSPYSGYINDIYIGDKSDIWKLFLEMYLPGTLIALFMMLLSVTVICYSGIIHYIYKKKVEISYLAVGLLLASIWLISESRLRQLILPNSIVANDVGFFMIMLIPYPFLFYINVIQEKRYQKAYMTLALCSILDYIATTVLQVMNIKDFSETMWVSHVIIVLTIGFIFITVFFDIRKGYIKQYLEVAIGFVVLMLSSLFEIILVYDKSSHYNGIALCIGLVVLLFTAGLKTGRDMLQIEKEKQLAIVAGESKARFLANMSHEIRTPINTVIGMNEMILRENKDKVVYEYAKNIQSASRMLLGLINDILDFSKIDAGKLEVTDNPYHLSSLLNDVILGVQVRAKKKNLSIQVEIEETMPSVLKGDEIRVKQILNNLLSNAVKYTEKGNILFTVKGINENDGFLLFITVKDTGIGIKKEDMEGLFDSFRRLELKKNQYIEGTGLGLSITKQLVERMQGRIEVESEYGVGTCFQVWLPQIIVDDTAMGNLKNSYKQSGGEQEQSKSKLYAPDASVLVVDDNEMNLAVMKALLKQTGIQLDFARGGNECIYLSKTKKYDLILMDHMMPDPDGVKTLHLLREDEDNLNQNTTVIVLTANAIAGVEEQYIKEGFADYLAKPVEYAKLEQLLLQYLICAEEV